MVLTVSLVFVMLGILEVDVVLRSMNAYRRILARIMQHVLIRLTSKEPFCFPHETISLQLLLKIDILQLNILLKILEPYMTIRRLKVISSVECWSGPS